MNDVVIKAENIGKRYRIGGRQPYKALRDSLTGAATAPLRLLRDWLNPHSPLHAPPDEDFWALRDVNFEIRRGEVVGLIGRNGAGKSTLLKILSRITEPTTGRIELEGRVGSLLEVGTGFHPELTGRENIFLNGAILGMKRREIIAKFDEIVEFAEIAKFIDTPVKHYSSGMYMRLAFSVAAHLEPEILLVDEVLAVGDAAFQKKCLGKMGEVAHQGRTVVFVSHNMAALNGICHLGFWLHEGRLHLNGRMEDVAGEYLRQLTAARESAVWSNAGLPADTDEVFLQSVAVLGSDGRETGIVGRHEDFQVRIRYRINRALPELRVGFDLATDGGTVVFCSHDTDATDWLRRGRGRGDFESICRIPRHLLNTGCYSITPVADVPYQKLFFRVDNALFLRVEEMSKEQDFYHDRPPGVMRPALPWQVLQQKTGHEDGTRELHPDGAFE